MKPWGAVLAVSFLLLVNAAVASGEGLAGFPGGSPSAVAALPSASDGDSPATPVPEGRGAWAVAGVIVALSALVAVMLVLALVLAPRMAKHLLSEGREAAMRHPDERPSARTNGPPATR